MQVVKRSQLEDLFDRITHATMLTIISRTIPVLRQTSPVDGSLNPWWDAFKAGKLTKVATVNGVVYWIYANAVNRRREKNDLEPDFVPKQRQWGHRLPKSGLVEHIKDGERKLYLELQVTRSVGYRYELAGQVLLPQLVNLYLPKKPDPAEGQGLPMGEGVMLRDYGLKTLEQIRVTLPGDQPGEIYLVVDDEPPPPPRKPRRKPQQPDPWELDDQRHRLGMVS